ncbi:hypothetical protein [Gymnodinialimonas ulvae]|uniref:hypothetical protein n=1 Tax=Gymnodinialimonas ulvae TaxID=3126504 RepID=UPI0030B32783
MRWFEFLLIVALPVFGVSACLTALANPGDAAFTTYILRIVAMILGGTLMYVVTMRHARPWIKTTGAVLLTTFALVQSVALWLTALRPAFNASTAAVELDGGGVALVSSLDLTFAMASAGLVFAFVLVFAIGAILRLARLRPPPH